MPHRQKHRGPNPQDAELFAPKMLPKLRAAVADLSELLSKGYPQKASLKLVGDHFRLNVRQRKAVQHCVASAENLALRRQKQRPPEAAADEVLWVDGYNLLITTESALAGAVVLEAPDGCYRDLASVHSSYRRVEETLPAIRLLGEGFAALGAKEVRWVLDAPISNSGRLRGILLAEAEAKGWPWQVQLEAQADAFLKAQTDGFILSSDSVILEEARAWVNFLPWWLPQHNLPKWCVSFL